MKVESPIAQIIRTATEQNINNTGDTETDNNQKTLFDSSCKRILSIKIFLAWIMKACMEEYKDCDVKDIAEKYIEGEPEIGTTPMLPDENILINGSANEDTSTKEGTIVYDIRFYAAAPKREGLTRLIVNVEAQSQWNPGYPLIMRGLFYCCRMISAQYNREFNKSHYEKIKKVVSIWICKNPTKERHNTINQYYIAEKNLVGSAKEDPSYYDLLSVFIIGLGRKEDKNYEGILELLEVILSTEIGNEERERILQEKFGVIMSEEMKGEFENMCNLSQAVEDKGIAKGIAKGIDIGIEKGIEQGIEKGKFEATLSNIQSLMYKVSWTAEQAMDALNIPQEERSQYLPKLKRLN